MSKTGSYTTTMITECPECGGRVQPRQSYYSEMAFSCKECEWANG